MAGRGRGRGRGTHGGLKGATWEYDPTMKLDGRPTELYPPHPNIKKGAALSEVEIIQLKHYKALQEQIHRGPLYTRSRKCAWIAFTKKFSEDQIIQPFGGNRKADIDPFLGVETYSMRYAPKKNHLPKLSDRPFTKEMFPKELWSTLEGEEGDEVRKHINRAMHKKTLVLSGSSNEKDKTKVVLDKIISLTGDVEDDEEEDDVEAAEDDEEFDDDELGGDYDAEQYFDGGEADSDGDGGGDGNEAF